MEGLEFKARYSDTYEPDDRGRWARIPYYKGLQFGWINKTKNQDRFLIVGTFPVDGNDGSQYASVAYTYEEAQQKFAAALQAFLEKIRA